MKQVSSNLLAHFGQDCMTLAVCWKAVRNDGTVYGFTTHDQDIVYNNDGSGNVTYQASTGFTNSAAETKSDMSPDNLEVTGFLDSGEITTNDIRAGLWDYATIQVFVVNWQDLTMGDLKIRQGITGQIKMVNGVFTAELRGLTQLLSTVIGMQYGPTCRAELGSGLNGIDMDAHYLCNIDITTYQQSGTVGSFVNSTHFNPSGVTGAAGYFNDGLVHFTSGSMSGFYAEIKSWNGTTLTTFLPMPYALAPGDTFTIEPGCDKTTGPAGCGKFNNIVNFRGENFIPGNDLIMLYPNSK
jgi:uncharacterized phage protein (TIGR02218 family)